MPGFLAAGEILKSGVYALLYRGEVIYIGKSKSMLARIYSHKANARGKAPAWMPVKGFIFDDIAIRPCHVDLLDELEYEMINLYKPRHNTLLKHTGKSRAEFTLEINGIALTLNKPPPPRPQIERRI